MVKHRYGTEVKASGPFDDVVARVKSALKDEGFGVLCEIDVAKTIKEKLGESFRPYLILGACNPALAHRALAAEDQLGLLLPCNVIVQQRGGEVFVSGLDVRAQLSLVGNPDLEPVATDVGARFERVLRKVAAG